MPIASNPAFMDDFLGFALDPRWKKASLGNGYAKIATDRNVNGFAILSAPGIAQSNAYLRLGEDPRNGDPDVRNWHPCQRARFETRLTLSTTTHIQVSAGFIGRDDPDNFLEFFYVSESAVPSNWLLAITHNDPQTALMLDTGFRHVPGQLVVLRIETEPTSGSPIPTVKGYINDNLVATYTGPKIPIMPLCPEITILNKHIAGGVWSNTGMWVDYVHVAQDR